MKEIFLLLAVILLARCEQSPSAGGPAPMKDTALGSTPVVLIFCDLSTSVDSAAILKVERDVSKLMLNFPYETRLYILPIVESPFVKPILDFTYPGKATRPSDIEKNKALVRRAAQYAPQKIKELYRKEFSGPNAQNKPLSCILRSLETAHSYFSQFRSIQGEKFEFELIYLSDMIEECKNSPVGGVFLTKGSHNAALQNLQNYKPDFDLSYARVSIIVSVDAYDEESKYISYEQLKDVWQKIFARAGFSAERFREFGFLSTIPPRFEFSKSPWK